LPVSVPPSRQAREILYGAIGPKAGLTAITEVFQETRVVDRACKAPCLIAFDTRVERAMPACPSFNRMLTDPTMLTTLKNACADLNDTLV
jgi:hypothetical protein